jgi:hypothetical protein
MLITTRLGRGQHSTKPTQLYCEAASTDSMPGKMKKPGNSAGL